MKNNLYWIVVGGLAFWLPPIVVSTMLHENTNVVALNILPFVGLALLGAVSWIGAKLLPKWWWVLAGIYILGPISMLAPAAFIHDPSSPSAPDRAILTLLTCLFPPMTLWMSLLTGMIFSVVIATVALPLLARSSGARRG